MDYVAKVKEFVELACKSPDSHYGYEPLPFHFVPTVNYGKKLASKLGADSEVVEIACWLHDIGSIKSGRVGHHLTGAKIAQEFLESIDYPKDKRDLVVNCIKNHRGSTKLKGNSLEGVVVAEADALSNFDNVAGIFKAAFVYEGLDQKQAKLEVYKKLSNKYSQLTLLESKKLVEPKFLAISTLFKD